MPDKITFEANDCVFIVERKADGKTYQVTNQRTGTVGDMAEKETINFLFMILKDSKVS